MPRFRYTSEVTCPQCRQIAYIMRHDDAISEEARVVLKILARRHHYDLTPVCGIGLKYRPMELTTYTETP